MLRVVTSVRDRAALEAACRELDVNPPRQGRLRLDNDEACGFVVRLPGLRYPVAFDLRSGFVAYHRLDNAFEPYARLTRLIHACYAVHARRLRSRDSAKGRRPAKAKQAV